MAEESSSVLEAPAPPAPPAPPATGAAPQPPSPGGRRGGGGAVWFGVVLLVIGAGIIMGRVAPGMDFWGFWPATLAGILFIVFGIRGMFWPPHGDEGRLNKVVEGLTGISVGVILISNSIGAVPWSVWWSVLSLWPVLLVSAGLDLIGKGLRSTWVRVLSSAVVLAALWYGAFVMPATSVTWDWWGADRGAGEPFAFSESSDPDVTEGVATIEGPVGRMSITDTSRLVTAEGKSVFGEPVFDVETDGSRAVVDISTGTDGPMLFGTGDPRLEVGLDDGVVWDLSLDSGVADLSARLARLSLSALRVESGVANATIELGDDPAGDVPVTFDAGISQLTLRVPRGTPVRIERDSGLSSTNIDEDLIDVGEGWESKGYAGAKDRYTIRFSSGISDFRVELY